jgi:hypothetical protein
MTRPTAEALVVNVMQAASLLGISEETFRKLRRAGELRPLTRLPYSSEKRPLFYRKQIEDMLDSWTGNAKRDQWQDIIKQKLSHGTGQNQVSA